MSTASTACMGSDWMQGAGRRKPPVVPRLLVLVIEQVVGPLMEVRTTGGKAGCLGGGGGDTEVLPR